MTTPVRSPDDSTGTRSPRSRGRVTLISGCMFSGKTTSLLERLDRKPGTSLRTFKHVIDRRYAPDAVVTHGGLAQPAIPVASPAEVLAHVTDETETVAIDEAHFFDSTLVGLTEELATRGMSVILTSLDRDSWGRPFPVVEQIRSLADEPVTKHATCARCRAVADHTQRLTPIINADMVGGPECYEPRCRSCWSPPPQAPLS